MYCMTWHITWSKWHVNWLKNFKTLIIFLDINYTIGEHQNHTIANLEDQNCAIKIWGPKSYNCDTTKTQFANIKNKKHSIRSTKIWKLKINISKNNSVIKPK